MSEALQSHLRRNSAEWEFIQVARALERFDRAGRGRRRTGAAQPSHSRSAGAQGAGDEHVEPPLVRYRTSPSMGFPVGEVASIDARDEKVGATGAVARVWDVSVNFLGMHGATGAMPRSDIGEALALAGLPNNKSLLALYDLLGAPFIRLFADAMRKYRAPLQWERAAVVDGEEFPGADPLESAMLSLLGVGSEGLRGTRGDPRGGTSGPGFQLRQLIRLGSAFAAPHRTAAGLADVLTTLLGAPVEVEQFQPAWREIPDEDRTRMGGTFARLGKNAVAGTKFCDIASGVLVRVGPIDLPLFLALLPSGHLHAKVADLVAMYAGHHLRVRMKPILRKEEVPASQLGRAAAAPAALGRSSWLVARERTEDFSETVVPLSAFDAEGRRA
jgi:type VI secretion system protein ImpH